MKRLIVVLFVFAVSTSNLMAQPGNQCEGNFDCDQDVDGTDASVFKSDFGRSPFSNPCPNCPPAAPVPKTGQTTSYATGDDGDLEKGVVWSNPRFTDNGDGTITDNLTGLIWMQNTDCFGKRNWNFALSDCNGMQSGLCGVTDGSSAGDWRLPNSKELYSLVDTENYAPPLPSGHPFTNVKSTAYWSSTTTPYGNNAWTLYMYMGHVSDEEKYRTDIYVWCVRGGQ